MINYLFQIPLAPGGGFRGIGPLGLEGSATTGAANVFTRFLSITIGIMTIVAIIWFIFLFIAGAYGIMSSGGDKQALEGARKKITTGLIGLVVTIAAIFIVNLVGNFIGIPNILDIEALLDRVAP